MSAPRVLFVTKGLDIGGLERVVVDLAVGLSRRGVPVEVAVANPRRGELRGQLDCAGIPVHSMGGGDHLGWAAWLRLIRLAASDRFDVIHVHGPLAAAATRLRSSRCGAPIVVTCHTPWSALHPLTRWAWRLTAHRDAATVSVSAAVAASLPSRYGARARVIPHGIDPAAIARADGSRTDAGGRAIHVVAVASHREAKNYPNLLRAVRFALDAGADLSLTTVGAGPRMEEHQALATTLGLQDVVMFLAPRPDVLDVIASGDLLVVASDYEGQPIVVHEALALGVPVVGTAVGRIAELVSPDVGRVVRPRDPQALGAAIAELALDAPLRASLASNARRRGYSWSVDDVVDVHLELYQEVVRGGVGGGGG